MDNNISASVSFVASVGNRQQRGNLSRNDREHLLQQSRFNIVDYATCYGCPTYTQPKSHSFNVEGLTRLASCATNEGTAAMLHLLQITGRLCVNVHEDL